jgi:ATP-dependent DNA ligase
MPLPSGFIPPCLPTKAAQPPSDPGWLHEIKHDGFRVIARKDDERVVGGLRARSLILDGEVVACGEHGLASFAHPLSPARG